MSMPSYSKIMLLRRRYLCKCAHVFVYALSFLSLAPPFSLLRPSMDLIQGKCLIRVFAGMSDFSLLTLDAHALKGGDTNSSKRASIHDS